MKFLITLSLLATSTVFAQPENFKEIKCYEAAQQNGRGDLAYVFEERGESLHLVYPEHRPLKTDGNCLTHPGGGPGSVNTSNKYEFCLGEGQENRRIVPIEASNGEEHTVYCQRSILDWFEDDFTAL